MSHDPVNHPNHYTSDPSGVECITITRHRNFNIGNAIKYLWRAGLKGTSTDVEDLRKAAWYIQDEITRLETFTTEFPEGVIIGKPSQTVHFQDDDWSVEDGFVGGEQ